MKGNFLFALPAVMLLLSAGAFTQGTVVLYNPQAKFVEGRQYAADEKFAKDVLVPAIKTRWSDSDGCDGSNLRVIGAVDGAFTRAGARQHVIVYEMCQTGNGLANNGVAVIENKKTVAHFVIEDGWNFEVSKSADINANGRDEVVIQTGGGMHQGYTGSSISVLELSPDSVSEIGVFLAYTNECETHVNNKFCDRGYKLTVKPGPKPIFFAQKYTNRGDEEYPRWVVSGKPAAAKRIGETTSKYELVK